MVQVLNEFLGVGGANENHEPAHLATLPGHFIGE